MISHRYQCIYVKAPKCASTTLRDYFVTHHGALDTVKPAWCGGLLCNRIKDVTRAINLYPDYLTFSFVRNPFRRFVSLYLHAVRLQQQRSATLYRQPVSHGSIREFAELCAELLRYDGTWGEESERFFAANADVALGPRKIKLRYLRFELCHVRRQTDFLLDFNRQTLFGVPRAHDAPHGFIGRVERFEEDLHRLLKMLDMPVFPLLHRNAAGAEPVPGQAGAGGACYDAATRRRVEQLYARDLELLGYRFEDGDTASIRRVPVSLPGVTGGVRPAWHERLKRGVLRWRLRMPAFCIALVERYGIHERVRQLRDKPPVVWLHRRRYERRCPGRSG